MRTNLVMIGATAAACAVTYAMGEALARAGAWAEKIEEDEFCAPLPRQSARRGAHGSADQHDLVRSPSPTPRA